MHRASFQRIALAALLMAVVASCSARYVMVPVVAAGYAENRAALTAVSIYLRKVEVEHRGDLEADAAGDLLREALAGYVARAVECKHVYSRDTSTHAEPALFLDVKVDADHTASRTWVFDIFGIVDYFLLTPQWGDATVRVKGSLRDGRGQEVLAWDDSGEGAYSMWFYSYLRTAPVEQAYKDAYAAAFGRFATSLAAGQRTIVAALQLPAQGPAQLASASQPGVDFARAGAARLGETSAPLALPHLQVPSSAFLRPLRGGAGVDVALVDLLTNYLAAQLGRIRNLDLKTKDDIANWMDQEKLKDALGCNDAACTTELAGAVGASLLVYGAVERLPSGSYVLSLNTFSVPLKKVTTRLNLKLPTSEDGWDGTMAQATRAIVENINSGKE